MKAAPPLSKRRADACSYEDGRVPGDEKAQLPSQVDATEIEESLPAENACSLRRARTDAHGRRRTWHARTCFAKGTVDAETRERTEHDRRARGQVIADVSKHVPRVS